MPDVKKHLTHLESVGLIRLAKTHPELEFMFRHALVQEAAYNSLLFEHRKTLHRQVGEVIEQEYPEQLDELAATLAHHFAEAGEVEKAINYLLLAGDRAKGLYANEEAIKHFREALALLQDTLPDESRPDWRSEMATQLHEGLGDVLELIGHHDEASNAYEDALNQVPKRDLIWQARLNRKIGKTWEIRRRFEAALQAYSRAETTLDQEPAESDAKWWQEWVQIQLESMEAYYWQAQPQEMAKLADKIRLAVEQYGTSTQRTLFFDRLIQTNFRRDRYVISDETIGYLHAMQAGARKLDDLGEKARSQFALGFSYLWLGELDEAEKLLIATLAIAEQMGDVTHQSRCLTYLTILSRKRGQIEETQHYISRALTVATTGQMLEYIATAKANLAWVMWREARLSETQKNGQAALELWPAGYPFRWTALWPLIAVALAQDQLPDAIEYTRALLEPTQQRLPDDLTNVLEEAIQEWEAEQSETARIYLGQGLELAQKLKYL